MLKISILVFVFVVELKNKNINKSTDEVDLPPKFLGVDSITVMPSNSVKLIVLSLPNERKFENSTFFINHLLYLTVFCFILSISELTLLSKRSIISQETSTLFSERKSFINVF